MTGMQQTIQCSLALASAQQGEALVTGSQGAEPVVAKPAPESPALTEHLLFMFLTKLTPVEPPGT
jgi:RNA-directed DNA polymerase